MIYVINTTDGLQKASTNFDAIVGFTAGSLGFHCPQATKPAFFYSVIEAAIKGALNAGKDKTYIQLENNHKVTISFYWD